jgi:trk system potassium uptake protein TrkH
LGYLSYSLLGFIILSLPFSRLTSVSFVDNLFVAVSAISTTGLSPVNVSSTYNLFGQLIILLLIQLGGIGYMTFGSFIILSIKSSIKSDRELVHKTAFSLPKEFVISKFIRSIVVYTLVIELIGAILLYFAFTGDGRANPIWSAIFHSVSSFCTAGFSLYSNSFESYANAIYLNSVVFALSVLGAVGYIVMVDLWLVIKGKKDSMTFTSKVILSITALLLAFGTLSLWTESFVGNGVINGDSAFLKSFFQAMTALTTVGFNTVPIGDLQSSSIFVIMILMIIGASPSGTGGGIKSTTISAIFGVLGSLFSKNKEYVNYKPKRDRHLHRNYPPQKQGLLKIFSKSRVEYSTEAVIDHADDLDSIFGQVFKIKMMKRTIPYDRVIHAVANFTFYFLILALGILFLLSSEHADFESIVFEAASALGTVGLSTGITSTLSIFGKHVIIVLMFIGRIGPIAFGVVLLNRRKSQDFKEYEDLVI